MNKSTYIFLIFWALCMIIKLPAQSNEVPPTVSVNILNKKIRPNQTTQAVITVTHPEPGATLKITGIHTLGKVIFEDVEVAIPQDYDRLKGPYVVTRSITALPKAEVPGGRWKYVVQAEYVSTEMPMDSSFTINLVADTVDFPDEPDEEVCTELERQALEAQAELGNCEDEFTAWQAAKKDHETKREAFDKAKGEADKAFEEAKKKDDEIKKAEEDYQKEIDKVLDIFNRHFRNRGMDVVVSTQLRGDYEYHVGKKLNDNRGTVMYYHYKTNRDAIALDESNFHSLGWVRSLKAELNKKIEALKELDNRNDVIKQNLASKRQDRNQKEGLANAAEAEEKRLHEIYQDCIKDMKEQAALAEELREAADACKERLVSQTEEKVKEAEETVGKTKPFIIPGEETPGQTELENAKTALANGNYDEAQSLATQAKEKAEEQQECLEAKAKVYMLQLELEKLRTSLANSSKSLENAKQEFSSIHEEMKNLMPGSELLTIYAEVKNMLDNEFLKLWQQYGEIMEFIDLMKDPSSWAGAARNVPIAHLLNTLEMGVDILSALNQGMGKWESHFRIEPITDSDGYTYQKYTLIKASWAAPKTVLLEKLERTLNNISLHSKNIKKDLDRIETLSRELEEAINELEECLNR